MSKLHRLCVFLFQSLFQALEIVTAMHELSIANSIFEIAMQHLQAAGKVRISRINLRIGSLSCVHRDALLFGFELITADTPLAGAELHITDVPISIYCPNCNCLQTLPGVQQFRCPVCLTPSADVRQGQELDIHSIEVIQLDEAISTTINTDSEACDTQMA
jgi:hydrogenase nickel incorporation protein HypA/HybF